MGEQPGVDPVPVWVLWSEADGDARLLARSLAVRSAAELLGVGPSEVWVSHAASGRPLLDGAGRGTQVSVSHGRGAVAVALCRSSRVDLGVDVESVRPLAALALARGYLTPAEADWLGGLAAVERDRAFLWLWTQKEAVGKALGLGLRSGGMSRPMPLPTVWPPSGDGPVTPAPLPDDPTTATTAVFVADGRRVVGVAVRGTDGHPGQVTVRVTRRTPDTD
ncbi:4'-phosphopantetheinyl transferase superfamily protein [Streptomyces sp. W16]|uniref:4'-phosphopantetheinyl transferase family protein n=1 Tax=Streptomyces sp. W16 TaxID=3076631 RepID=UPI00295C0143|nr:4'-phosphopantetheinyl transferase superfamily protein [Streptomyces sp. W16]MDV9175751.1 4'-phosphopantetheinyl transferase superfamily protein [Streptomyces sp. W16]